jgi:peptide/nickel transport system substrate-binding protein
VIFRFYTSTRAAVTALLQDGATGARFVPPEEVAQLRADKRLKVFSVPNLGRAAVLFLNNRKPPFNDPLVRRALALGVDRVALVDAALSGHGHPAYGPICPLSWGYRAQAEPRRDVDQARRLLEQAGWRDSDGDGVVDKGGAPLEVSLATSDHPERLRAAVALAGQLADIGVKVQVDAQTWEDFRDKRLVPHDFTAALAEVWLPNRDPDVSAFWHSSEAKEGLNFSGWQSGRADDLLLKGRQTWSTFAREEVYAEFQTLFAAEAPAVFLYYPLYSYAISGEINGARLEALLDPSDRFRSLSEWYIRTKRAFF